MRPVLGTKNATTGVWKPYGSQLTMSEQPHFISALSPTLVASLDVFNNQLETYQYSGGSWAQLGNSLSVTAVTANSAIAALSATTCAVMAATGLTLKHYTWDGTDWTENGSSTISGTSVFGMDALSSTRVAIVDGNANWLRAYDWGGTTWAQAGNSFSFTGADISDVCALSSSRIAVADYGNQALRAYDFDGTDWTLTGNSYAVTTTGSVAPGLCKLSASSICLGLPNSSPGLRRMDFDGTDWAQVGAVTAPDNTLNRCRGHMASAGEQSRIIYFEADSAPRLGYWRFT